MYEHAPGCAHLTCRNRPACARFAHSQPVGPNRHEACLCTFNLQDQTDTYSMFSSLLTSTSGGGGAGKKGDSSGGGLESDRVAAIISQCLHVLPHSYNIEAVQNK